MSHSSQRVPKNGESTNFPSTSIRRIYPQEQPILTFSRRLTIFNVSSVVHCCPVCVFILVVSFHSRVVKQEKTRKPRRRPFHVQPGLGCRFVNTGPLMRQLFHFLRCFNQISCVFRPALCRFAVPRRSYSQTSEEPNDQSWPCWSDCRCLQCCNS